MSSSSASSDGSSSHLSAPSHLLRPNLNDSDADSTGSESEGYDSDSDSDSFVYDVRGDSGGEPVTVDALSTQLTALQLSNTATATTTTNNNTEPCSDEALLDACNDLVELLNALGEGSLSLSGANTEALDALWDTIVSYPLPPPTPGSGRTGVQVNERRKKQKYTVEGLKTWKRPKPADQGPGNHEFDLELRLYERDIGWQYAFFAYDEHKRFETHALRLWYRNPENNLYVRKLESPRGYLRGPTGHIKKFIYLPGQTSHGRPIVPASRR